MSGVSITICEGRGEMTGVWQGKRRENKRIGELG